MNQEFPDEVQETTGMEPMDMLDDSGSHAEPSERGGVTDSDDDSDASPAPPEESAAESSAGAASSSDPESPDPEPVEAKVAEVEQNFEWYVLRVQSGREDTVSNNLRKKLTLAQMDHLVRDIAVPKQKITEIKEGKKKIRSQKLFPGYVFLEMVLEDELWYLIRDTSGIGDFVGSHQAPIPMPASEVHKIRQMMEEEEEPQEVQIDLVKNDGVKIKEGPFENFDGVVEEVHPAKGMVRVMVSIFGRSTPVDLEYWQVEKL